MPTRLHAPAAPVAKVAKLIAHRAHAVTADKLIMSSRQIIGGVAILGGICLLIWLLPNATEYFSGGNAPYENPQVQEAKRDIEQGQYAQARSILENASKTAPLDERGRALLEVSKFSSGTETDKVSAVRDAKAMFANAYTGMQKAYAIDRLIAYASGVSADTAVFKEIFAGEPFHELYDSESRSRSLKNLAETSLSFATTTTALQEMGRWEAIQIIKHHDGVRTRTSDNVEARANRLVGYIHQAETAFDSAPSEAMGLFPAFYAETFHTKQAALFGALSLVKPEYLASLEEEIKSADTLYQAAEKENKNLQLMEARMPYAYLQAAAYVHEIGKDARKTDALNLATSALHLIVSHPQIHEKDIGAYLRDISLSSTVEGTWLNKRRVVQLAALSPEFKQYLLSLGWRDEEFK